MSVSNRSLCCLHLRVCGGCISWGYMKVYVGVGGHKALKGLLLRYNRANICVIKSVSLCSWTHYIILLVNKSCTVWSRPNLSQSQLGGFSLSCNNSGSKVHFFHLSNFCFWNVLTMCDGNPSQYKNQHTMVPLNRFCIPFLALLFAMLWWLSST